MYIEAAWVQVLAYLDVDVVVNDNDNDRNGPL